VISLCVPKLRFPEFSGEWDEFKFGKYLDIKSGYGFKASEYVNEGIPLVKIDNVSYGKIKWETKTCLPKNYIQKYSDLVLNEDDILLALNRPITQNKLKIGILKKKDAPAILYQRVGKIIFNNKAVNKKFAYYNLTKQIYKFVLKSSVGSDQPFISTVELKKLKIKSPNLLEQQKIASFLSKLDKKIDLLETKYFKFETYKKGLINRIFTQKVRFKSDVSIYSDWQEKKLKTILKPSTSNLAISNLEKNFGNYPLYGANGYLKSINFYEKEVEYIAIVKDGSGVGKLMLCKRKSSVLGTLQYLDVLGQNDLYFIYYLLLTLNFKKYIIGSTIPHIYFKDYSNEIIRIPSISEQIKIANLLTSIDKKMEQTNKEIEINKEFKKGLLQKMFC